MNCFIATLGGRDVQVKKNEQFFNALEKLDLNPEEQQLLHDLRLSFTQSRVMPARKLGQLIENRYQTLAEHLCAPIIESASKYFERSGISINRIILVATNQNPPHPNDTVFFARYLKKFIIHQKLFGAVPESEIRITEISGSHVHLPDVMYETWLNRINGKPFNDLSGFDKLYLQPQGGIDAINQTLTLNLIAQFGQKVEYLYKGDNDNISRSIDFPKKFLRTLFRQQTISFIKNYEYQQAAQLAGESDARHVLQAAHYRTLFSFQMAFQSLDRISSQNHHKIAAFYDQINILIDDILHPAFYSAPLTQEVFYNLELKWRQGQYVDWLSRMFRLYEEMNKERAVECIMQHLGIDTFPLRHEWAQWFNPVLDQLPDLKKYLDEEKIKYDSENPTTLLYDKILHFFQHKDLQLLKKIQVLSQLRNNSIGAHGFRSVSKEEIQAELHTKAHTTPDALMHELRKNLGCSVNNPFDSINELVLDILGH
ncbi:MAG: hypothetical protein KatS3mg031_2763 [Chitinophagales bacterium]|nr:MAG: hypothetical protein KatS3mg031_2763 [Chitinophagales bacterium]